MQGLRSGRPKPRAPARDTFVTLRHALPCGTRRYGLLDFRLDGFQVEARALLHRRKLDRSLGELADFLLHELEPPELVSKPVIECQRPLIPVGQVRAFERIEADVGEDWPIKLD